MIDASSGCASRAGQFLASVKFSSRVASVVVMLGVIALGIGTASPLLAQVEETGPASKSERQSQAASVTTHGLSRYRPGRWGTISVEATNRGAVSTSIEAAAWIGGRESDQFGRSVWVPAEARRSAWTPIFIPPQHHGTGKPMLHWMAVRKSAAGEVLSQSRDQDRIETRQLIEPRGSVVFAVITGTDERHLAKAALLKYSMEKVQPDAAVLSIPDTQLPAIPEALDAVNIVVVIGDTLSRNAAATETVQDWVHQGGTLWLMLDTMSHESAQVVCSGELLVEEIDRVTLTSYSLFSDTNSMEQAAENVDLERPVQLVRVDPQLNGVLSTVDGWPAAFKTDFGMGRIFGSMLSLDGFFIPPGSLLPEQAENRGRQLWTTTAGQDLVSDLGGSGSETPLDTDTMTAYVNSRIGYQLPNRSAGATVLVVFCVALIVVCGVVHRWQKPVLLLPGIGILSVLAIVAFLQMADSAHSSTDSSATIQMVEANGTLDRLHVTGMTAYQAHRSSQPTIGSTAGGLITFDGPVNSSSPVRMLWSDQNAWNFQNAKLAAGVRLATFRQTVAIQEPAIAKGTFDESGFRGQLTGNVAGDWSDAIIADQSGFALPVSIDAAGEIAHTSSPLPPGQHLSAAILNAEQSRRQAVYRSVFDASRRSQVYPSAPTLLAWADRLTLQTGRADEGNQVGAMLASFPIVIERPASGSRVLIPSTFLPFRAVRNKKLKIGFAPTFSNTRRTWSTNTYSTASTSLLRFEIPVELLPLVIDGAKLTLNITAPLRDVEISSGMTDSLTNVWSKNSPVGTFEIPLPHEASRQLDENGGLHVALKVGAVQLDQLDETELGTQDRNWQVEWLQLEIQGLIQ
ncbi:MAG: hypothetical protein ACI8P0_001516 [Planctomycetaceae bacterium]|jgi:hypothetical protein